MLHHFLRQAVNESWSFHPKEAVAAMMFRLCCEVKLTVIRPCPVVLSVLSLLHCALSVGRCRYSREVTDALSTGEVMMSGLMKKATPRFFVSEINIRKKSKCSSYPCSSFTYFCMILYPLNGLVVSYPPPVINGLVVSYPPPVINGLVVSYPPPVINGLVVSYPPPVINGLVVSYPPPVINGLVVSYPHPVTNGLMVSYPPPVINGVLVSYPPPVINGLVLSYPSPMINGLVVSYPPPVINGLIMIS